MKTPYDVIIKPVISERSMDDAANKKYTFKVATDANKTQVKHALEETAYIFTIAPIDIYHEQGSATKNITIRIQLTSYDKTLTNDEVHEVINKVINIVESETEGKIV